MSLDLWLLVLSGEDGRSALVHTAQTLCQETSLTLADIDPSFIENRLPCKYYIYIYIYLVLSVFLEMYMIHGIS